jgi:pyridoxamine 5'-phosphate oxidase
MTAFRERLRALPSFPPTLPSPGIVIDDPDAAPPTPHELFAHWFDDAVEAGVLAPHAVTLSTADAAGHVHARTLVLKDVNDDGWWFAGRADSPKGRDLAANPQAAMTFFWRELGRQVRVTGNVTAAGADAGAADFAARPEGSRAAGLVGRQSDPLGSRAEYDTEFARALDAVRRDPELVAPAWTAWVLTPVEVEFWQASESRAHLRLHYRAEGTGWGRSMLWP